jgi:electron transport complex protein RnfG
MIVVLTCVGLISGGFLASVGILTEERIVENKQREIEAAIGLVVPGTENYEILHEEDALTLYSCQNEQGTLLGYAVLASGTGFQDKITLMFGTDTSISTLNSLAILEQKETPGLGANITSEDLFLRFWLEKDITAPLSLKKPAVNSTDQLAPNEINTITGATISSEKVMGIVNLSLETVRQKTEGIPLENKKQNVQ